MAKSTKPGTAAPTAKAKKAEKIAYPGIVRDESGKVVTPLKEWPADYNPKIHIQLKRTDFETEAPFYERLADLYEQKAKKCREIVADAKLCGNAEQRAKAKKLKAMAVAMAALQAELKAEGIDLSLVVPESASAS